MVGGHVMTASSRLLAGFGLGAPLLLLSPLPYSVQLLLSVTLLAVAPGLAMARALGTTDPLLASLVTVTGSLAATIAASTILLYLELWSGAAVSFFVGLFVAALELRRGRVRHAAA